MSNLHVIMAAGSTITTQIHPKQRTFLMGFFSVNLKKTVEIARGYQTLQVAVPGSGALKGRRCTCTICVDYLLLVEARSML
jgi:hypothetical protein